MREPAFFVAPAQALFVHMAHESQTFIAHSGELEPQHFGPFASPGLVRPILALEDMRERAVLARAVALVTSRGDVATVF